MWILNENAPRNETNKFQKITISTTKLKEYFPTFYTRSQIENVLFKLLEDWKKENGDKEGENMFVLRKLLKVLLLPVFFLLLLLKAIIVAFENLTFIVIGAMVLLIGFGIGYCIYSHRYQEIIIFLVVGMIMMAGMFAVTVVEGICDTLTEKISDL